MDSSNEPHIVRALGAHDVTAFRDVLRVFAEAFGDSAAYLAQQPDDSYLARLLASDAFVAVASFSGGEVVGGLTAYVLPKFEQNRHELFIYDLAVAEPYRRRGIATDLIAEVQRLASDRGIYAIFVQADGGDDAAIELYSKLGPRDEVLHFDIPPGVPSN